MKKSILLSTFAAMLFVSLSVLASDAEVVATFNAAANEAPENLYIDFSGNRYVTLALTGEVKKITPSGQKSTFVRIPLGAPPLTPCLPNLPLPFPALLGIDRDLLGNFYFANKSCNPEETGIWKFDLLGRLRLLAKLPIESVPNGIAYVAGNIYAADTFGEKIWKVPANGGIAQIWSADPLLKRSPGGVFPGPNGLKYFRGEIYVSVSDTALIVAIPLNSNGSAGQARVHATIGAPGGPGCDDFAFDILGNLYCGTDPFNTILKITPTGNVSTILTAADGLDGPTAVFFGRGQENTKIYITNGAFPFFSTTHNPTLMRFDVGIPASIVR